MQELHFLQLIGSKNNWSSIKCKKPLQAAAFTNEKRQKKFLAFEINNGCMGNL